MRIKIFQKIIDKLRNKKSKKKNLCKNNFVAWYSKNKYQQIHSSNCISISGKNNKIIFLSATHKKIKGLNIVVNGNNNVIVIEEPNFNRSSINISGDNNTFSLKKTVKIVDGAIFHVQNGSQVLIDENCEIGNGDFYVVTNGDYENQHKLVIGKNCHIARNVLIRTSDGECLIDKNTKLPISEPQDVIINDNCWITSKCTILKGSVLPKNTIVGANSLVNKKFEKENTLIGGVPAKVLKEDIHWTAGSYRKIMELNFGQKEQKITFDVEKFILENYNLNLKNLSKR
ncbi:MAG: acyltransferase [Candidatus Gastranaerophilales bacterium]|nr:acyltransferase [Candidatus Gastranaerophilales bacterium]